MSGQEALSGERTSPFDAVDAGDGSCCSKTATHATATASESETQPAGQPQPVSAKAPPHQQRGKKPKVKPADATIIAKTTAAGYNNFATTGGSGPTPAGIMASGGCGTGRETMLHGDATLNYDSLAPLGTAGSERRLLNFGTTRPGSSNASRPASATSRHQRRMMQARRGKDDYGAEYSDLFSRLQKIGSTSAGRETTGAKTIANLGGASFQFGDHHPSNYYPPQSAGSAVQFRREQNDVATGAVSRPQSGLTTSSYNPRPQSAATADGKTLPMMQQMQLPVRKKSPVQKWKQHCAKKMIKEWKEQQKLETVLQEQRLREEEANRTPTERLKIKLKQQFFRDEDDMEVDVYEDDGASEVMSMSSPEVVEGGEQEQAGGTSGLFSSRSTATRPQSSTGGGPHQHQRPLSGVSSTGGARPLSGKTQTQSQSSKQRSVQENSLYLEKLGISETDKGPVLTCLAEALITSAVTPSASRPASSAAAAGGGGGSGIFLNRSGQNKSSSKMSLRTASAHDVLPEHGDTDTPRSTHEHAADHCDDPLHGGFSAGSQKSDAELVQALAKGRDVPDEEFLKDLNYLDAIHAFPRGDGELKSRFSVCDGSSMERIPGIEEDGEDDENDLLVGRSFLAEDRSQERVGESVFHLTETKFADHSGSRNAPPVGGAPATSLVFAERRVASFQDETLPKNTSSQIILLAGTPRSGDHAAPSPTASSGGATKSASTNLLGGEKKKKKKTKRKPLPPPKPVYVKPADPAQIKRVAGLMRTLDDLVETSKILGDACDETADELSKLKKRSRYEQEAIKLLGVEVEKMQLGTGGKGVPLLDVLTRLKLAARDVERKEEHENEAKKERMRSGTLAEMDGGAGSAAGGSMKKLHSNMSKSVSQVFNQRDSNSFAGTQQSFIGKLHQRDIRCETSKNLHADRKRPKSATERMRDTQEVLHVDEAHCPLNPPPPARPDEEVYQEPSKQKKHPEVARLEHGSGLREEPPRPPPPERRPWSANRGDKQKILLQQTRGQGGDLLKRLPR
eukprot:g12436.t1